jgi:NAD(P)-dependent dehydrogenase (short-subunit alcohol dehydrogenase family)
VKEVRDRVAFITGGASGIGLGIARAFLRAGMRVVIADIRDDHLQRAKAVLEGGARLHALKLDVCDREAVRAAADETQRVFGNVHVLCNNAGVGMLGGAKTVTFDDWDWGFAVNVGGVINGIQTFLPRMLAHGEGGHIVNTSSIGAVFPGPGGIVYLAAKSAVAVLSEALKNDLLSDNVGVTVLLPGPTATNIHEVGKHRPAQFQNTGVRELEEKLAGAPLFANGLDPAEVGEMVLDAVQRDLLFVFTHNDFKAGVAQRFEAMLAAFPRGPVDPERAKAFGFPVINEMYTQMLERNEPPAGPAWLRENRSTRC